jgi:hypothetical protein
VVCRVMKKIRLDLSVSVVALRRYGVLRELHIFFAGEKRVCNIGVEVDGGHLGEKLDLTVCNHWGTCIGFSA